MFEKLMFWKKEPEPDFSAPNSFAGIGNDPFGQDPYQSAYGAQGPLDATPAAGFPEPSSYGQFPSEPMQGFAPRQQAAPAAQSGVPYANVQRAYDRPSAFAQPSYAETPFQQQRAEAQAATSRADDRAVELVISKLDAIKMVLESINTRLQNMERLSQEHEISESTTRRRGW